MFSLQDVKNILIRYGDTKEVIRSQVVYLERRKTDRQYNVQNKNDKGINNNIQNDTHKTVIKQLQPYKSQCFKMN
jgi:NACalpha-BTF3-like transcription factor